jgi:hypothetical protein
MMNGMDEGRRRPSGHFPLASINSPSTSVSRVNLITLRVS